jgi:hypothetical protein
LGRTARGQIRPFSQLDEKWDGNPAGQVQYLSRPFAPAFGFRDCSPSAIILTDPTRPMDFTGVKTWLAGQAKKRAEISGAKAVAGFVLAPAAVAFAATCIYEVLRHYTRARYPQSGDAAVCFWVSLATVPGMFLGNRLMPRRSLMEERMEADPADLAMARFGYGRGQVFAHMVLWILFTGPRLMDWAIASLREQRQWKSYDIHSCAAVLWLLASRLHKVPYEEIQREIPWLDLDATGPQLMKIPGVLKLQTTPAGLALTDDLRKAVCTGGMLDF